MMALLRSLLLLFALLTPAWAEGDGPKLAASAKASALQLTHYLDSVIKTGARPAYGSAPAANLLQDVYNTDRLATLPAPQAGDVGWLLDWGDAANRTYKQIVLFDVQTSPALDEAAVKRNLTEYEDQCTVATDFLIRVQARALTALLMFMNQLTPDQRTPVREAGLKKSRSGAEELVRGALISVGQGMKPANARTLTAAIRDTRDVWSAFILPRDRDQIIAVTKLLQKTIADAEVRNNLAAFADMFAVK
jgi:hypothetical protein